MLLNAVECSNLFFLFNVRKRQLKATANQLLWQQEINNKQQTEEKTPKVLLNQKKQSKK